MKLRLFPLILALALCLSACTPAETPTPSDPSAPAVEEPAPADPSAASVEESADPSDASAEESADPSDGESAPSPDPEEPVITPEEFASFGVTVKDAAKKAKGFRSFEETLNSDFTGTWFDPELGEALRLTEDGAYVYIPYLDLYGDRAYPWEVVDRSEEGKVPKLSIQCFDNGASLVYYVAGNTGTYFWCVSQGQLFYRQD